MVEEEGANPKNRQRVGQGTIQDLCTQGARSSQASNRGGSRGSSLRTGLENFESRLGLRRGKTLPFWAILRGLNEKARSARGRKHVLWGQESRVPKGDLRLRAALTTGAPEGFPWPWCVAAVRNFQPITGLGWNLSGLASPPPPWGTGVSNQCGPTAKAT